MPNHFSAIGLWPPDDPARFPESDLLVLVSQMVMNGRVLDRREDKPCEVVLFEYFDASGAGVVGVTKLASDGRALELGTLCPTFRSTVSHPATTLRWSIRSKLQGAGVLALDLRDKSREPRTLDLPVALRHLLRGVLPVAVDVDDPVLLGQMRESGPRTTSGRHVRVSMTGFVEAMSYWPSAQHFLQQDIAQPGSATFEECLLTWHADQVAFAYPMGLREDPPEPRVQIRGEVLNSGRRRNAISGWEFDWAVIETPWGPLDLVIPALDPTPVPGSVLLVDCRLVGRIEF